MRLSLFAASILLAAALPVSSASAFPPGPPPPPPPGGCDCEVSEEIRNLRHEVAAIKLDNLLNLSADQAKSLLELSLMAQQQKKEFDQRRKKAEPDFIKAMTQLRDELKATGEISEETAQKLRQTKEQLDIRGMSETFDALAGQALAILTSEQKEALKTYDPRPLTPLHKAHDSGILPPPGPEAQAQNPEGMPPYPKCMEGAPPPPPHGLSGMPPPPPHGLPGMPPPPHRRHHKKGPPPAMILLSEEFIPLLQARVK